jgi:exopolyphosphatase / guanosine-5'-triphosphate,3'-diphosphate pyrophosphatase
MDPAHAHPGMRVAVIDLGTNTFNLLIAEHGQRLHVLHTEEVGVFLGQDGIEDGRIADAAMQRGWQALQALSAQARAWNAERIIGIGTSALRNARNASVFIDRAQSEYGVGVTVIQGDEEAGLILEGARQAVTFGAKPMLVMDIGGGSIEFILATDKALMWKRSFELGVTRLRERFIPNDPITLEEHLRIATHLDARLEPLWSMMDRHWPRTLVGCAGSFDTLAAMVQSGSHAPTSGEGDPLLIPVSDFDAIKERLMSMPRDQRAREPGLPEFRVDTITLALITIERVLLHGIERIAWSPFALKEGAAARLLAGAAST